MDEGKLALHNFILFLLFFSVRQRQLTPSCNYLRRTSNKFRHTVPKLRTSSVVKIGFEANLVSPTSRLKPNPFQTPPHQTQPPLPPSHDPDQNPTSAPPHCLQIQTGVPPRRPVTDTPKRTSLPKVSQPPYQVSFTALPPPLLSPICSPITDISLLSFLKPRTVLTSPRCRVSAYTLNRLSTHSICQLNFLSNCSTTALALPSFPSLPILSQIYPLDCTPLNTTPCLDHTTLVCSRER